MTYYDADDVMTYATAAFHGLVAEDFGPEPDYSENDPAWA